MDAVLRLPRSSQTRFKRVSLIYHRSVAFCKAFHCLVASDKTTKPVRPFGSTHSASARQSRACAWWGGPPYDRYTSRVTARRTSSQDHILTEGLAVLAPINGRLPRTRESNALAWFTTGRLLFARRFIVLSWLTKPRSQFIFLAARTALARGSLAHAPASLHAPTLSVSKRQGGKKTLKLPTLQIVLCAGVTHSLIAKREGLSCSLK